MKEYKENNLRNISSTRHPSNYHPTSDDSAGSLKSSRSQKMKRKTPQDRYVSNITREVKNLTADISEVKAQQADMIKSESNLQSTLKSKFSPLNDSIRDTTSTQKRDMKDLETKIDNQVGMVAKKLEERATSQMKKISSLESSISSTIKEKFKSVNSRADHSDARIRELSNQVIEIKTLLKTYMGTQPILRERNL